MGVMLFLVTHKVIDLVSFLGIFLEMVFQMEIDGSSFKTSSMEMLSMTVASLSKCRSVSVFIPTYLHVILPCILRKIELSLCI
jgi:hypothetical protein